MVLPLKSHGYLYEIIAGMSRQATEQRAARQEIAAERDRARQGERRGAMQPAAALVQPPAAPPDTRPARVPPPVDFRRLAHTLLGKIDRAATDDPT